MMKSRKNRNGFSRVELAVSVACVSLLAVIGIAAGAGTRDRSERSVCMNNLRHIGRAYNMWASDHGDANPVSVDYAEGGMRLSSSGPNPTIYQVPGMPAVAGVGIFPTAVRNNVFLHFLWLHRELGSPKMLVCPADVGRKQASDFSNSSNDGFLNTGFQNNAVSYFVWLHAFPETPRAFLNGDRNIDYTDVNTACSANVGGAYGIYASPAGTASSGWRNMIHGTQGNCVRNDGSVEEYSSQGLKSVLVKSSDDNGYHHFLGGMR